MSYKSLFWWSTILSLPFYLKGFKKKEEGEDDTEPQALEPAAPPVPQEPSMLPTMPAGFKMPPEPEGYSRMKGGDVPTSILPSLRPLLAGDFGTRTKLSVPGRDILAQIEPHYHEPGGPTKPWGWHKGVSLYERKGQVA